MSGSLFQQAGGYIDPTTGMWVPAAAQPTPQQAQQSNGMLGRAFNAVGGALMPALYQSSAQPSGPGGYNWEAAGDPYQSSGVPQPGAPIQSAPKPYDPTVFQANLPPRNDVMAPNTSSQPFGQEALPTPPVPPKQWPQATSDAPPTPTPDQAAASAQRDASGPNYNTDVQAASQPSPKAPSNATPADYSTAAPPPDAARALVVQNAAQKYGVPLEVANWVGFHESNWNNNVGTNAYGATGPWQFKKATAQQYGLQDPNDFNSSTDAAMRLLADNFKKTGNWADAVAQYGTFSTGKGADADAAARNGFVQYAQNAKLPGIGSGVQVAGPGAPTGTNGSSMAPDQQQQLAALGINPSDFHLPFDYNQAVQPSTAEKLYRMAAALQGNAGQAAGLMAGDRQKMLEANNNELATQRLAQQLQYQNAGLGIRQQVANNGTARVGIQQQNADTAGGRLQVAQQALAGRLNPQTQAALAQGRTAGQGTAKDINSTLSTQAIQADAQGLADINNAQTLIQQKPELMGPTLASRWSRFAAENGLSGDAADLNALQKMTTDQRNTMLSNLTNGHVGGIRSNAELQNISKAVADVNTSPAAAQFILNMQKAQIEARQAWRQEIQSRFDTDPESITGQRYDITRAQFLNDWNKAHPLPDYQSPSATNSAGTSPGKNADGSTKGAATLRYDQATGRMVPM